MTARREPGGTVSGMEHLCVLDLGAVTFRWDPASSAMSIVASTGELLIVERVPQQVSPREAAALAADAALARTRVLRRVADADVVCRIGWYNPHTRCVAVAAMPNTVTFSADEPLELSADGEIGVVAGGVLRVAERALGAQDGSLRTVTEQCAAHPVPA